jgi:flagellum-specific ATP synthase
VLDRAIAERGRFPAINILRSVSRTMPACNSEKEREIVTAARKSIATYEDMAELIRLGAYKTGSNAEVDHSIILHPLFEKFLTQRKDESTSLTEGYQELGTILAGGKGRAS